MKRFIAKMKPGKTAKGISLTVLELADDALGGIPIPGAKGGIRSVLDLIKGIDTTSRNSATLSELEKHIRFLTELLEPVGKMDSQNLPPGLEDEVGRLNKDLESIASNVKSKVSAGVVRRFLEREEDENNLRTFAQSLKQALDRFHTSQIIRQRQELHLQGQELRLQRQELLLKEQSALVKSLPRAQHASYDSDREDAPLSCLEGTRVAILAEITTWLESTDGGCPSVYWLNGLAGIGKSTIAKTIAGRADEKHMLGGSFFFSQSDEPLRNPRLVFPTLAFQLAQLDNGFKNIIGEAIEQDAKLGERGLLSQLEGLILTPLRKLGSDLRTTLIVLDALDECEEEGAATILQLLLSHATTIPCLRILITSRPEPHISSVFNTVLNHAKTVLHDIEASVVQEDIRHYITTELGKIPRKLHLRMGANWASEEEIDLLVDKSGKLFVYAATSIRFISDNRARDPRRQLGLILSTETAREVGAKPYGQLDNLYKGVLRNALSDSNHRDVLERFQVVVGSIVLLREPLPLHSLAQFVECEMDKTDSALHHLSSVIIPPSNDYEAPRIYHPSFRDFIMDASRCSDAGFLIVPVPAQERRHAIRCFELMGRSLKRDVAGISDVSLLNSEVDGFDEKVRDAMSPEVQYACRYWASHLSRVEVGDKEVVEALEGFSMGSILVWFEAMSLIGSIPTSASSIQEAHRWAISSKCKLTVMTMLSDANRFILAHAETIRASALQVYHSALAFTPQDTALYKRYWQGGDQSIRVLQGVESEWSRNLSTLVGHSHAVVSIAFSPDGLRLASGSRDDTLRLWDAMLGAHIATLEGHSGWVTSVAFSPDGLRLASSSYDHTVRLWDGISGAYIATLEGYSALVSSVAFSPDGLRLVTGSHDCTLWLRDAMSGAHITTLTGHSDAVTSVAFSPDGLRLASGSNDCTLRLWDATSGAHITTLEGHSDWVTSVAFSPDGLRLASGSYDHTLRLWDGISGAYIATLEGHSDLVTAVAFSPDGLRLASGSFDVTLRLWDAMSGVHIETLEGQFGLVLSVAYSPDSLRLASGSNDHTLRLWDAMSGPHTAAVKGHTHLVSFIAFSPDGLRLASGSRDNTLRLWDAMSGAHIMTLKGHSGSVTAIAFSPDGSWLASGSGDYTLRLWDAMSGAHITTLEGHSSPITSVAFSPDSLRLASGCFDSTLRLWDVISGACTATLEGHSDSVTSVAFSIDSHTLIAHAFVETFTWDVASEPPHRLDSGSLAVAFPLTVGLNSLVWSTDDPWVQVQHPEDNHPTRICCIPAFCVRSTPVQASGLLSRSRVAVGTIDGRVIILDIQHHPFVHRLRHVAPP